MDEHATARASSSDAGEAVPVERQSYWVRSTPASDYPPFAGGGATEVAVLGGGIVGLTTALLLARAGVGVTLLEAARLAEGVSGYTTAKLTVAHGLAYSRLARSHGEAAARDYARSQSAGLELVRELVEELEIDCDLEETASVVYAESEEEAERLEEEQAAARIAGLAVTRAPDPGLPFPVAGALRLEGQAQLHPRRYLLRLAEELRRLGGGVYEHSRVLAVEGDGPFTARLEQGELRAPALVCATHYPIVKQARFVPRIHPYRGYVVAGPLPGAAPEGIFLDAGSPTRSLRTTPLPDGRRLLLVGGEGHKVGHEPDTRARYDALEAFLHEHFPGAEAEYRWSTQDLVPVDGLPLAGGVGDGAYVATGFAGWGMTGGTTAALLIAEQITGTSRDWHALYDPGRVKLLAGAGRLVRENLDVAGQLLGGRLRPRPAAEEAGALGDAPRGEVVSHEGRKLAVATAPDGAVHAVSATCTHMGCVVAWNDAESSWDCPCHGSRFAADGRVLHGPATTPLEPVDVDLAGVGRGRS